MNYEIVNLEEKKLVGVTDRTKNSDSNMTMKIGALWKKFYNEGIYKKINNKLNEKAIGMYYDYESDVNSEYSVTVGCEVSSFNDIPKEVVTKVIQKGKYAKFIVKGHMQKAVANFWQELWKMDLDRNYKCDFEEYQNADVENAEIHIYISIN